MSHSCSSKIIELIGGLITDNMLLLAGSVDSLAFITLMKYLEPSYKVQCKQTMTAVLEAKKEVVQLGLSSYN